jgi:amidase
VAANLCTAAVGAEVDGSIVRPSSINSIVGLKPTVGLISRSGVIGVAEPQDTAGPMARSVADLSALLNALTGFDPDDPRTREGDAKNANDYRACLDAQALEGARIGVARDLMGAHEGTDAVIDDAIQTLRALGAKVIDPANGSKVPFFGEDEIELFLYEMKAGMARYLATHPKAPVRTLDDLIEANRARAKEIMPYFQQEVLEAVVTKGDLTDPAYMKVRDACRRMSRDDGIDKVLAEHRLDAIIAPTDGHPAWSIDPIVGDHITGGCSSTPAMAGYPHITVPAGYLHGLPVALSFFSTAWQEAKLIGYAYAFEQATKVRRPPTFPATVTA